MFSSCFLASGCWLFFCNTYLCHFSSAFFHVSLRLVCMCLPLSFFCYIPLSTLHRPCCRQRPELNDKMKFSILKVFFIHLVRLSNSDSSRKCRLCQYVPICTVCACLLVSLSLDPPLLSIYGGPFCRRRHRSQCSRARDRPVVHPPPPSPHPRAPRLPA